MTEAPCSVRKHRWHTYYRTAFAYRLAEEDWFDIPNVDEFKISYARGTAGGRPAFEHRFETWNVSASGVSKSFLGNRDLRPEHTLEQEVTLDMVLFRDYGIRLGQSWQKTTEQLVRRDIPTFTGYANQWANGGTVVGHTTEVSVEARFIETPGFSWTSTIVGDRSRGEITEWAVQLLQRILPLHLCRYFDLFVVFGSVHVGPEHAGQSPRRKGRRGRSCGRVHEERRRYVGLGRPRGALHRR